MATSPLSGRRGVHPFPARMAPEIAFTVCEELAPNSVVLDPMSGSGTVARVAAGQGHDCLAFDLDPLSVLMSRVSTYPVDIHQAEKWAERLLARISTASEVPRVPWIDDDKETLDFINFWFPPAQQIQLRHIAAQLRKLRGPEADVLRVALSRIIITKEPGVSRARDTSHSRPHRVIESSSVDVVERFRLSVRWVCKWLQEHLPPPRTTVALGDARDLLAVEDESVDAVITSPPYLNAIDYMRGHKLALVWLGFRLGELRQVRTNSVGAERAASRSSDLDFGSLGLRYERLGARERGMVDRYANDMESILSEVARVLRPKGRAVFVIGNSSIKGVFIPNSEIVKALGRRCGLTVIGHSTRRLRGNRRYLPPPSSSKNASLAGRMRTEVVLTFNR